MADANPPPDFPVSDWFDRGQSTADISLAASSRLGGFDLGTIFGQTAVGVGGAPAVASVAAAVQSNLLPLALGLGALVAGWFFFGRKKR